MTNSPANRGILSLTIMMSVRRLIRGMKCILMIVTGNNYRV